MLLNGQRKPIITKESAAPIMSRAYSVLTVKAVDEEQRIITGTATTPTPDRMGDIVEPLGVTFAKDGVPLLWQHRSSEPVGRVKFSKPTKDGVEFTAKLPKVEEPGRLKDRVDEAWQSVKLRLVRGVSIGFRAIEYAFMDDGGIRFIASEIMELSLVTIPANTDAMIETIKALDAPSLAASGISDSRPIPPASREVTTLKKATTMRTIQEQIDGFVAKRGAHVARMKAIMDAADGETLDAEQSDEHDTLAAEVDAIDKHLVRLNKQKALNAAAATPVVGTNVEHASASRSPVVQVKRIELPKGMAFVRMVGALASAKGNRHEASIFASRWRDSSPEVEAVLRIPFDEIEKSAVSPGTTTNSTWAEPLVQYQNMASEFIEYLRPLTIIGRIQGFRRVPFKIKVPRQTAGAVVNWVGETKVKPLSSLAFDSLTLDFFKIAGIIPLSEELIRFSSPSAEMLVRDDLAAAIVAFMDSEFIDPSKAEAATVSPASITNGVTPVAATGTTATAFRADVKTLFGQMIAANMAITSGVWIMKQSRALAMSLMVNALGQAEFPGITMNGGTLLGFPVVTSEAVHATGGSPANGDNIIFAVAGDIMLADDGAVTIDMSREASLQMETAPDSPPTASTVLVSLWQHNMVAIKAERFINWKKRRATAVGYIAYAKYGA